MKVDKKARGSRLRFVVLDDLARPAILDSPPMPLLEQSYAALAGTPADAAGRPAEPDPATGEPSG
jgi:hypothetical protein